MQAMPPATLSRLDPAGPLRLSMRGRPKPRGLPDAQRNAAMRPLGWAALSTVTLAAAAAGLTALGSWRWREATRALVARLDAARRAPAVTRYDEREIESLPAPVQRYFRAVLTHGQPMILAADVEHAGTFNMSETAEQWKPFTSSQHVTTSPPGFVWNGRIMMAPGVPVRVHDAYVAGEGLLRPSILGLYALKGQQGTETIARGELLRYLAEAVWYPTALLPTQGTAWRAVDDRSAEATLADGALSVTMLFRFGNDGVVTTILAADRGRLGSDGKTSVPWECRMSDYRRIHGMLVPFTGEAAWILPERDASYYRGTVKTLAYELAR